MRLSRELRDRALRKQRERLFRSEMVQKEAEWKKRLERAQKYGEELPPGGVIVINRTEVWYDTVREWIGVMAGKLQIDPRMIAISNHVDLTCEKPPNVKVKVPPAWFELKGVAEANRAEAAALFRQAVASVVKATQQDFLATVRKRFAVLGLEPTGAEGAG
jgi:hypothetical protein